MDSSSKQMTLLEAKQKDLELQYRKKMLLEKNIINCEKNHDNVHKSLEKLASNSVVRNLYSFLGKKESRQLKKEKEAKTLRKHMEALKREHQVVSREIELLERAICILQVEK